MWPLCSKCARWVMRRADPASAMATSSSLGANITYRARRGCMHPKSQESGIAQHAQRNAQPPGPARRGRASSAQKKPARPTKGGAAGAHAPSGGTCQKRTPSSVVDQHHFPLPRGVRGREGRKAGRRSSDLASPLQFGLGFDGFSDDDDAMQVSSSLSSSRPPLAVVIVIVLGGPSRPHQLPGPPGSRLGGVAGG